MELPVHIPGFEGATGRAFDAKLEQRLAETRSDLRQEIANVRADLLKWMFVYWLGSAVTTASLVLTVGLLRR